MKVGAAVRDTGKAYRHHVVNNRISSWLHKYDGIILSWDWKPQILNFRVGFQISLTSLENRLCDIQQFQSHSIDFTHAPNNCEHTVALSSLNNGVPKER
jgi:hypothetical protein